MLQPGPFKTRQERCSLEPISPMIAFAHAFETEPGAPDDLSLRLGVSLIRGQIHSEHCLSERESRRYAGFPAQARRDSFLLGRKAIKQAICAYHGDDTALRDIDTGNDLLGAPYCDRYPVNITLSHCGDAAIALVSHRAVRFGVDLEAVEAFYGLADHWFEDAETDLLASNPAIAALETNLLRGLLWVSKEALGKALGTGLAVDWAMLTVARIETKPTGWTATFRNVGQFKADIWHVGGYVVACALPRTVSLSDPTVWLARLNAGLTQRDRLCDLARDF
ncbi:hypothetical protein DFQ28_011006 [Apophysomyces sp. BC1034]|nr:hypothetical protein DFQ28_011006 [Apophysomyces sp. BC1034]